MRFAWVHSNDFVTRYTHILADHVALVLRRLGARLLYSTLHCSHLLAKSPNRLTCTLHQIVYWLHTCTQLQTSSNDITIGYCVKSPFLAISVDHFLFLLLVKSLPCPRGLISCMASYHQQYSSVQNAIDTLACITLVHGDMASESFSFSPPT